MSRRRKIGLGILAAVVVFLLWPWRLSLLDDPHSVIVESADGDLLSAQIASDGQWRFPIVEEVPERFAAAITAYEDERFYYHLGVDPLAIVRAFYHNVKEGRVVSGASTLSMQLIRLSYRHAPRTISQKLKEMLYATKMETRYSKRRILRYYSTYAPFGGNVVGLETAAWRYFGKSPDDLSWSETATLAVLPNAPSLVTLEKNRTRLKEKRDQLLHKLHNKGEIDAVDLELALSEPIVSQIYRLPHDAPHYLERMKRSNQSGRIQSVIVADLQRRTSEILSGAYRRLSGNGVHNAATIILDNSTGEVITYVGNIPNTSEQAAVDMIRASRSSGSILKPFLYAAMVDEGLMTPDAFVRDVPISIDGFSPSNFHRDYQGAIPVSQALAKSLNVPFVLLLQQYGVDKFARILRKAGIHTIDKGGDHYGLSLILGGAEVTLWDLVHSYSDLSRALTDEGHEHPVFELGAIYHTLSAMEQLSRPDLFGQWEQFSTSRRLAWKTGTSYGHRDAWAVGVTPDYTIGVWGGNADGEGRDQLTGVTAAGQLLFEVLDAVPAESEWYEPPVEDMEYMTICAATGMLAGSHCAHRDTVLLAKVSERSPTCPYHRSVLVSSDEEHQLYRSCDQSGSKMMSYLVLPPIMARYYRCGHSDYEDVPPLHPECEQSVADDIPMEMIYPYPDETVYLPHDFEAKEMDMVAEVSHRSDSEIYWYLDGAYLGVTREYHTLSIRPAQGEHRLVCIDEDGYRIATSFSVVGAGEE